MIRYISPIKVIFGMLMSAMLLTGMSCGAGGFSMPLKDQSALVEQAEVDPEGTDVVDASTEEPRQTSGRVH